MVSFINDPFGFEAIFGAKLQRLIPDFQNFSFEFLPSTSPLRSANAENTPFASNPSVVSCSHIVYNNDEIKAIGLTENEIYACIAHEIGHYVNKAEVSTKECSETIKEIICDSFAAKLGLQFHLALALVKIKTHRPEIDIADRIDSLSKQIVVYRPEWTCGRYIKEKHAAIYYNLIEGMCYSFEAISADVAGIIFTRARNAVLCLTDLVAQSGLAADELIDFLRKLFEIGLITDKKITNKKVVNYRKEISKRRLNQLRLPISLKERLPFEHASAETDFAEMTGGISVMLELTYNCSEKCIHCYNIGAARNDEEISHRGNLMELDSQDYKRIIDELYEQGLFKVCLSGGDPFSKPIVWEIISYLYKLDIAFDIYTNAQLLFGREKELAWYYPRLVGVSIYSANERIHDNITRIKGSLSKSVIIMRRLGRLAVPMNLKCCVMRPNMHSYHTVLDIARQVGAVPQFEVSITDSIEGDKCVSSFLRLRPEELTVVLRDINVPLYVGPEVPNFGEMKRDYETNVCGAGYHSFCITPDGKLIPCCAFHLVLGDLKTSTVGDILNSSEALKQWRSISLKDYSVCGKYEYCSYCNLCPGNNYTENQNPLQAGENNCYIARVRFGLAGRLRNGEDVLNGLSVREKLATFVVSPVKLRRIKG